MFVGYLLVAPLMFFTNSLTSTLGAIVHFYLFLAIFGVMMPSKNDWCFIFHALLLSLKIRSIYFSYSIVVYIVFTVDSFWRTADFFLAILAGMIMFLLYLGGLFAVAIIAQRGKLRDPQIFFVPYKTKKPTGVSFPEVEDFEDWEDL